MDARSAPSAPNALAPDLAVEAYKAGIDRSLLRENLSRSPTERVQNLMELQRLADAARASPRRSLR